MADNSNEQKSGVFGDDDVMENESGKQSGSGSSASAQQHNKNKPETDQTGSSAASSSVKAGKSRASLVLSVPEGTLLDWRFITNQKDVSLEEYVVELVESHFRAELERVKKFLKAAPKKTRSK